MAKTNDIPDLDEPEYDDDEGFEPETETDPIDEEAEDNDDADDDPETTDSEDETPEDPDGGLPKGVRKRIDKLTAKRRDAERRAQEAEQEVERLKARSGEGNPKSLMAVAEKHGILSELIGAEDAKALKSLEDAEQEAKYLTDLLDDLEDSGESEIEISGKTFTAAALRKLRRQADGNAKELREAHGSLRKELSARTAKLLRLGLAAEKEAARKGPAKKARPKVRTRPEEDDDDDDTPSPSRSTRIRKPERGGASLRTGGSALDDSLQFIADHFLSGKKSR